MCEMEKKELTLLLKKMKELEERMDKNVIVLNSVIRELLAYNKNINKKFGTIVNTIGYVQRGIEKIEEKIDNIEEKIEESEDEKTSWW